MIDEAALDAHGCAVLPNLLAVEQCATLAESYADEGLFRSRVVMARHGFGRGEYKYFAYPLPESVAALRNALYPPLAAIANRRHEVPNAASPPIRSRRLQLPASGSLRRSRLSAAGCVSAVAAGRGFHR